MASAILVDLRISKDEYLRWYQGSAHAVYARALDGRSVNFPANILRPFVSHDGIKGRFAIQFDDQMKFKSISRVL